MNETVVNSTSVRNGKDLSLDSPLLNLILAASLLSKITKSKTRTAPSYSRMPPLPLRYSENYYDTFPWYPHNAEHYYKVQTALNNPNVPIKQHVIHIYRPSEVPVAEVNENGGATTKPSVTPTTNPNEDVPTEIPIVEGTNTDSDSNSTNSVTSDDETIQNSPTTLTQELKDFLTDFFKKNLPPNPSFDAQNSVTTQNSVSSENNLDQSLEGVSETAVSSDKIVENMSETLVDKLADDLPENATQNEVKHMSEIVIQNLPTKILENIPPEMLEQISEKISEQISEKLSEKFSKDVSNHMLEKLSQLIPERTVTENDELALDAENRKNDAEIDSERNSAENEIPYDDELELPKNEKHVKFLDSENAKNSENENENETDYREVAASNINENADLEGAETQKSRNSAKKSPNNKSGRDTEDEYVFSGTEPDEDDDEDEDDTLEVGEDTPQRVSPKFSQKLRTTTESSLRKNSKTKLNIQQKNSQTQERINSKRPAPNKKKTTPITLIYDEYEDATPSSPSLTNTNKRRVQYYNGNIRKPTKPTDYDQDEEDTPQRQTDAQNQRNKNKKITKKRPPTTSTTPIYDDYYNDPVDQDYDNQNQESDYEEEAPPVNRPRPSRRPSRRPIPRQNNGQTTTTESTTGTGTDTDGTDMTTLTPTPVTSTTQATNVTSGEYPYYGNNNYQNISITYGPPVHHYPGYGPSNGNEHVSFTYAPPTGTGLGGNLNGNGNGNLGGFSAISGAGASGSAAAGVAPMVDNWYNQYARAHMYKRLQDLLTPNNFYNQYDGNYNDGGVN